jgi:hypothetical protein
VTPPDEGSGATAPGRAVFWILAGRYRLCLTTSCWSCDFTRWAAKTSPCYRRTLAGSAEALEAIAQALDERRSLVLTHARYARETGPSGVIINLANVVSVRVSKTDSAATGQYL